jgi:hypothetical protein
VIACATVALVGSSTAAMSGLAALAGAAPLAGAASRAGIVPPRNPPKNIAPNPDFYAFCVPNSLDLKVACNSKVVQAVDGARATEPLGPLHFSLQKFLRLSVDDQLFAIADLERVSRGEPPMTALTSQLDAVAAAGAVAGRDPVLSTAALSGGALVRAWGSNWAENSESPLGADDGWMYDDGYGSSNYDCRSPNAAGCWGHRDNILQPWSGDLSGCRSADERLVMGAGFASSARLPTSFTEIFVASCGPKPAGEVFTWAEAQAEIGL